MIDQPVQFIKGVGPAKARILSRIGINTINDLLTYFPKAYEDRRTETKIAALIDGNKAVIRGKVEFAEVIKLSFSLSAYKAAVFDGTGIAFIMFFRKVNPYHKYDIFSSLRKELVQGAVVAVSGQAEIKPGEKQLRAEEYEVVSEPSKDSANFGRIIPVYRGTEGLNLKWLRNLIKSTLDKYSGEIKYDIIPDRIARREELPEIPRAVSRLHFPDTFEEAETARQRIALNEFLLLETALAITRKNNNKIDKGREYGIKRSLLTPFRSKLGFEFTHSQKKVINEIFSDMQLTKPMNRLLMGDVGSGKTVVALSAMLLASENGYQSAFLSPTEILAEQHYVTLKRILQGLPVSVILLTSKGQRPGEKKLSVERIKKGEADIVIGTHALLQGNIAFKNLGLTVIDEQHRFGVLQREAIRKKGLEPDVLVMTATPIPRTLALTVYGDLDVSVIDELPPGRKPVETMHLDTTRAYELVKKEISNRNQAFIVYPLIEESDKLELKAAVKEAKSLAESVFKGFRIGLLHGQMPSADKERTMEAFRSGAFDILISTTVIEVGIDIPNATVMVIEHADRFGLATLHQLRGRIGRGSNRSFCVLIGQTKTDEAKRRFNAMLSASDGFKIAEEDLDLRGPGEFFGTTQHGLPELKAGNVVKDLKIIDTARRIAAEIVENDEGIDKSENSALKTELKRVYGERFRLSKIG